MERIWTSEQKDAIYAKGGSILVSAAAGSGKTAVLVQRIIESISNEKNNINIDELLVVTFSNAAADEIKHRIGDILSKLIKENPNNSHLAKQQKLMANSNISTIHSFCLNIIKENFNILSLSANVSVADATKLDQLKVSVLIKIIEDEYEKADKSFFSLVDTLSTKTDKALEIEIIKLHKFLEGIPFAHSWVREVLDFHKNTKSVSETIWAKNIYKYSSDLVWFLKNSIKNIIKLISKDEKLSKAYLKAFESDLINIEILIKYIDDMDWDKIHIFLKQDIFVKFGGLRNYQDENKKNLIKEARENTKYFLGYLKENLFFLDTFNILEDIKYLSLIFEKMFDIVLKFYDNFNEKKRENNFLSFSDLEHLTLKLLLDEKRNKTKYAQDISGRFKEIFIDEYQDTNEIQELIFCAISKCENNLFMVGDVKQSIYRFRQAMPKIFSNKMLKFSNYDSLKFPSKINLDKNFRSRVQVTEFINYIFSKIMTFDIGEIDYDESQKLICAGSFLDSDDVNPQIHILNLDNFSGDEKIKKEARYVAQKIKDMLDGGYIVEDNGIKRRCLPKDFCVLMRSIEGKQETYIDEFKKLDMSLNCNISVDFFKTKEGSLIINILKVIDNKLQDIPLLALLVSPIFDFSVDDVVKIRMNDKSKYLYDCLILNSDEKVDKFISLIEIFSNYSIMNSVHDLVQTIYNKLDIIPIFGSMKQGALRVDNLHLFLNYLKTYNYSLSQFIKFVDNCVENEIELKLDSKDYIVENSITMMSIHRSKGLEYPICILSGLGKKFNFTDIYRSVLIDKDLGYSMQIRNIENYSIYSTLMHESIKLKQKKEILSEEMRILYVAMTRAKEKLIMIMTVKNFEKKLKSISSMLINKELSHFLVGKLSCYTDWILLSIFLHPSMSKIHKLFNINDFELETDINFGVDIFYVDNFETELEIEGKNNKLKRKESYDINLVNSLRECLNYRYIYGDTSNILLKISVTDFLKNKKDESLEINKTPKFMLRDGITPAEKGSILHTFMQFADFKCAKQDLDKEISRLIDFKYISREKALTLNRGKIINFLESDIANMIIGSNLVEREVKFRFKVSVDEIYGDNFSNCPDKIVVQGIADCLIFEDDGIVIIDYKTDFANNMEELKLTYRPQLLLYKRAVEETFGKDVKTCIIYSLYLSEATEI